MKDMHVCSARLWLAAALPGLYSLPCFAARLSAWVNKGCTVHIKIKKDEPSFMRKSGRVKLTT
jgi:hypothetical protein